MHAKGQALELGGVRLPEFFNGGDLIDGVAISADGSRYGIIVDGAAQIHDMPQTGVIPCGDGKQIKILEAERAYGRGTSISRNRMVVNGVKLPPEFNGGNIAGDVVVSPDQTQVAVIRRDGKLLIAPAPESGQLQVNGMHITLKRGGGVSISTAGDVTLDMVDTDFMESVLSSIGVTPGDFEMFSFSMNSGKNAGAGRPRGEQLDNQYPGVSEVRVNNLNEPVRLAVSQEDAVHLIATAADRVKESGSKLKISSIDGMLKIPAGVDIRIESVNGPVTGEIASGGRIETVNGNIALVLKSAVNVRVSAINPNQVDVQGMLSKGKMFTPPEGEAAQTLRVETVNGAVTVRYEPESPVTSRFQQYL